MFIILSHNNGESARALADRLGCRLASHNSPKPLPSKVRHIINLGCGRDHPVFERNRPSAATMFNIAPAVSTASSKAETFRAIDNVSPGIAVPHWFDSTQANYECLVNNKTIVARTLDRAAQGRGIEVITPQQARDMNGLPRASVYTEAIDKGREYRVHVGRTPASTWAIIDVTRKIRRPGVDDTNRPFIWNSDNEFIFVRDGVNRDTIPSSLLSNAIQAVASLGLTFGAVDIIVPRRGRTSIQAMSSYVLEVNTSPGMEGTTLERYAQYFEYQAGIRDTFTPWSETVDNTPETEE